MKKISSHVSRREFLKATLIGAAGVSILPFKSCMKGDDSIRLGFIGLGRQVNYLQDSFLKIEGVKVVAGADVYADKRERFKFKADQYYKEKEEKVKVEIYEDYKDLLARKDIDAVVIGSPDHWHARMAIDACNAGKDIYLEKPLTLTIKEGQEVVKAVQDNNVVLAVGSQQRSDPNFQHAVNLALNGDLGKIESVQVFLGDVYPHPKPYDLPKEPLPEGLNWDMWIGPAPMLHFNNQLNPPISLDPRQNEKIWGAWRWYTELGGGLMTDWGAHMMDIAQWGLGLDRSGPVKVIPRGFEGEEYLTYIYENGIKLINKPFNGDSRGVKFWGEKGWIEVTREYFNASDPSYFAEEKDDSDVPYEGRSPHHKDFINSIRTRNEPAAPVVVGHKTCVACTLGNIAAELGRAVEWDPEKEVFINDPEAEKYLHREYKHGYSL
ncbi:MAG: Gfo/Idh/MocA family protein [Bacteroidota bacterium]